jgi:hypothetical protein
MDKNIQKAGDQNLQGGGEERGGLYLNQHKLETS